MIPDPGEEDKGNLGNYFGDQQSEKTEYECCNKILVVDDEYMNVYALRTILKVSFNL